MNYEFRGYDAVGGKGWVYGDLVHNQKVTKTGLEPRVMVGGYEVDPKSVGMFTGLYDKNGKKIFEGDIIDNSWCFSGIGIVCFGEYQHLDAQIGYKNGDMGFYVKHLGECKDIIRPDILFFAERCEIIGTIYEQNQKK